ncbi:MAG: aromatic ring-hydroxylating oxygenase subunit alpha [Hyphomicrobiales bacterium]
MTDHLLEQLNKIASTPMREAFALPPEIYTSPGIKALEDGQIFARDWTCPGLAAQVPNPGDYLTWSIGEQPVFSIRNRDGEIKTFANVCRHRMMQLLTGQGNCRRVVCPYHAWTYDLDGQLIGAPFMDRTSGFDKSKISLPEIRTEVWQGWIYVTLNEDAKPVADLLAGLADVTGRFRVPGYVLAILEDHVWQTNWKLLVENFMEGYHLPVAHKNTVGAWMPVDSVDFPESSDLAFAYQTFTKDEDATYGRAHPDNDFLEGHWRYTTVMPTVFPTHMYVLAPDHLWYLSLRPKGIGEVHVRFGVALAPEAEAALTGKEKEKFLTDLNEFFRHVNEEDRFVVEGIYAGAKAPLTEAGPLSWLERELHDFAKYLASRLTDTGSARVGKAAE